MNQIIKIGILTSVMAAFVSPVFAVDLTDAEANKIAVRMENVVTESHVKLKVLVAGGHREKYRDTVRLALQGSVNGWPADNLKNRAIFPYFSCRQAAVDLLMYGDSWAWIAQSTAWRDHMMARFRMDHAACRKAIVHPDQSLKNVQ